MRVEREYKKIEQGTNFSLKKALSFGENGSFVFAPITKAEESAYQAGLGKLLVLHHLPALDPTLIYNGNIWRGFAYEMVAAGKIRIKGENIPETDQKTYVNKRIGEIQNSKESKNTRSGSLDEEGVKSFKEGLILATDYLDFVNYWVPQVYEIKIDEILPEHAQEFFRIHRQIQQDVGDQHPVLGRMELFLAKEQDLEKNIEDLHCNEGLNVCDYLEVLLMNMTADRLTESLLRDGDGIKVVEDEIEVARIHSFDIPSRLEDVQKARKAILLRMENPTTFPLDEELNAAIELERFETAAAIRDVVAEIRPPYILPEQDLEA